MPIVANPTSVNAAAEREFWRNVEKREGCWAWSGRTSQGYAKFEVDGERFAAHRFSFALHNWEPPVDMLVCHTCDNPACTNPDHLYLGSPKENTRDAVLKGRVSSAPQKTSWTQAGQLQKEVELLHLSSHGIPEHEVARRLSVDIAFVRRVRSNYPKSAGGTGRSVSLIR